MLARNRRTEDWAPVSAFFDIEQFMKDIDVIVDTGRGRALSLAQIGLSFLRNFDERKAPAGFTLARMLQALPGSAARGQEERPTVATRPEDWEFLWIGSMWFQDLWTYDFRRTEMCVIPYATQEGEISFCAYNTGVGWRQIVENMHMVATTQRLVRAEGTPHDLRRATGPSPCRTRSSGACRWSRWRRGMARPAASRPAPDAGAGAAAAVTDPGGVFAPRSRSHGTLVPLMRGGGRFYSRPSRFQEVREIP